MNKYIVETTHEPEDCLSVLKNFAAYGHITHFDWGCENGVCSGWAVVEAENESEALFSVPPIVRNKTRIVKVTKFSPEMIQKFHEEISG